MNHKYANKTGAAPKTLEEMVVYQAMYGDHGIWVRPAAMFEEVIEREGKTFRRFEPISEDEALAIN